jgi:hypothetical protein
MASSLQCGLGRTGELMSEKAVEAI